MTDIINQKVWDDLVTSTLETRSSEVADIVKREIAVLAMMEKDNIEETDGGTSIERPLQYAENQTFGYYSGWDTLKMAPQQHLTMARFAQKYASVNISISGQEMIENNGKSKAINLLKSKIGNAETTMKNNLGRDMYSDGSANDGKQIGGFGYLFPANPALGTVGGIGRATNEFWRSKVWTDTTDGGAAATAANIIRYLRKAKRATSNGSDSPDKFLCDDYIYDLIAEAAGARQFLTNEKLASLGFDNIKAEGLTVLPDGGLGDACPEKTGFMLNSRYIYWQPVKGHNIVPMGGDRSPLQQNGVVKYLEFAGNLTCSNCQCQTRFVVA